MRALFNYVRRWRDDRKNRKLHASLVAEMRATWTVVNTSITECTDTSYGRRTPVGSIVFVTEKNDLGERRVRFLSWPSGWKKEIAAGYPEALIWAAKASPISLPLKEREAV